jgi:hypothetical protein
LFLILPLRVLLQLHHLLVLLELWDQHMFHHLHLQLLLQVILKLKKLLRFLLLLKY